MSFAGAEIPSAREAVGDAPDADKNATRAIDTEAARKARAEREDAERRDQRKEGVRLAAIAKEIDQQPSDIIASKREQLARNRPGVGYVDYKVPYPHLVNCLGEALGGRRSENWNEKDKDSRPRGARDFRVDAIDVNNFQAGIGALNAQAAQPFNGQDGEREVWIGVVAYRDNGKEERSFHALGRGKGDAAFVSRGGTAGLASEDHPRGTGCAQPFQCGPAVC